MMAGTLLGFLSPFFTAFTPSEVVFGCPYHTINFSLSNGAFSRAAYLPAAQLCLFFLDGCGITAQAKP